MNPNVVRRDSASQPSSLRNPLPIWKRAIDLSCCLVALPVLLLTMAFMALLLGVRSPGPLFFRQERVGYLGRRFMLLKFRTMHPGADPVAHQSHVAELLRQNTPMRKLDGNRDPRLVPGGWLMRATGLDELPQIINVLRGDMSIVGPRPCIPYEYQLHSPPQRARFRAVPGLTGLWQVSGKNRTTFEEMVAFDLRYAETRSPLLDLRIIARTLPALWTQVRDVRTSQRSVVPALSPQPVDNRTAAPFQA